MQIEASLPPVLRRKEKKLQHQTQTEEEEPKKMIEREFSSH